MTDAPPHDGEHHPPPPSPVPFVVALVLIVVAGGFALLFLRADDDGELVRPDRLVAVDDDTVRVTALDQPPCRAVERAQVDYDDDRLLLELVVVGVDGCEEGGDRVDVVAEVDLPEPLEDRTPVAGVGRTRLPCTGSATSVSCGPDQGDR